jgi:hypothetical protein
MKLNAAFRFFLRMGFPVERSIVLALLEREGREAFLVYWYENAVGFSFAAVYPKHRAGDPVRPLATRFAPLPWGDDQRRVLAAELFEEAFYAQRRMAA